MNANEALKEAIRAWGEASDAEMDTFRAYLDHKAEIGAVDAARERFARATVAKDLAWGRFNREVKAA